MNRLLIYRVLVILQALALGTMGVISREERKRFNNQFNELVSMNQKCQTAAGKLEDAFDLAKSSADLWQKAEHECSATLHRALNLKDSPRRVPDPSNAGPALQGIFRIYDAGR